MSILFDKITIGDLELPNRIIMAPLTRARATENRIPTPIMAEYYRQRASAGLIISEATSICPMGVGYANTPGIWSSQQIKAWQPITQAVHDNGGRIFLQLWHVGRVSDPLFLNGKIPVAPSPIAINGHVRLVTPQKTYVTPRELTIDEITEIINDYKNAAINAKEAGFDGVEIHGANGYLLDQFLQDRSNKRKDIYGGSIENRAKLMLEVTDEVIDIWGNNRVGMHLAPRGDTFDMGDSDKLATFSYIARELGKRKLAFLCAREALRDDSIGSILKKEFNGVYIANEGFDKLSAERIIDSGNADAVAFGKLFIANPDLPERFASNKALNTPDSNTFYTGGSSGYIDYPR